ncbi:MAG: hypothetical protein NTW01_02030 [Gammaproteobacteria bacterium]|nr:hypothetical protein [Gammaproteobacteria bacterium]
MRTRAAASAVGLAAVSLFWSAGLQALGLGEVEVRSRLNERFAAAIPLDAASREDLDSLVVQIAAPEEFARRGIERSEQVGSLRFERNGSRILVGSAQAIRDPFLNFIVEARWNGGRLLREYTVLLDPPSSSPAPAAAAAAPRTITAPTPLPLPTPARSQEAPASAAGTPARYGPVLATQTLWSIAKLLRSDPVVTMDQMLLAIYNANPTAFGGGSINYLLSGEMLAVPSTAEVLAIDAASAHEQVTRLRASGKPPAAAVSRPAATPADLAPAPAPPPPAAVPVPDVAASTPMPAEPAAAAAPGEGLADGGAAPPSAASTPAEVGTPSAAAEPPSDGEPAAAPAAVDHAVPPVAAPAAPPAADTATDLLAQFKELPWLPIGGLLLLIGLLLALRQRRAASSTTAAATRTALAATPDLLLERPWSRAPAPASEPLAPDQPAADPAPAEAVAPRVPTLDPPVATAVAPQADEPLPGHDNTADLAPLLDASDALAEADFHLAYGLYDEAAQMLKKAIAAEPARTDLVIKLAETYSAAGNAAEFQALAENLEASATPETWQKIKVMGRALLPELPLFGGQPSLAEPAELPLPPPVSPPSSANGDLSVIDFDLDAELPGETAPVPAPPLAVPPEPEPVLTLADERPPATMADPVTESLLRPLDEPVVEFDLPPAVPPALVASEPLPELNLPPLGLAPPVIIELPAAPASEPPAVLDIDLSSFDLDDDGSGSRADAGLVKPASAWAPPADEPPPFEFEPEPESEVIGGDEIDTKLDLARAYADMGDLDAARALLAEVEIAGNDRQQQDARALSQRLQG